MTDQRYLEESSVREFEATVERVVGDRVVLDATHFYPTGGGQPNDTGWLRADGEEWSVVDVSKKDTIYHRLDGDDRDPPEAGTRVTGELDWERRYAHMRYHTAQHLLSALLLEAFDAETTGNQLYTDHAHLDCAYPRFTETDLADIEARLNELVDEERPVEWYVMDRETAEERLDPERTRLALLPDSITEIRIVEIGGAGAEDGPYDRTACAGTHVANTGEIGAVEVTGRETKGSETERIEFELTRA